MAGNYTYTGNPSDSLKDQVRYLLRDIAEPFKLTDDEILWEIDQAGSNAFLAAANAAEQIATNYGALVDRTVGPLRISYKNQLDAFTSLSKRLRSRYTRSAAGGPVMTQASLNHIFEIGMHDITTEEPILVQTFGGAEVEDLSDALRGYAGSIFSMTLKYWTDATKTVLGDTSIYRAHAQLAAKSAPGTALVDVLSTVGGSGLTSPQNGVFQWDIAGAVTRTFPRQTIFEVELELLADLNTKIPFGKGEIIFEQQVITP